MGRGEASGEKRGIRKFLIFKFEKKKKSKSTFYF
jgi:hypothetical protein